MIFWEMLVILGSVVPQAHSVAKPRQHGVNLHQYRPRTSSTYTPSHEVRHDMLPTTKGFKASAAKGESAYIDIATRTVRLSAPDSQFRLIDDHYVDTDGIAHVHFTQTLHGIDIDNTNFKVNVRSDGTIISYGHSFIKHPVNVENPLVKRRFSDPHEALKGAIEVLGLPAHLAQTTPTPVSGSERSFSFSSTHHNQSKPQAHLLYYALPNGTLALTWRLETDLGDRWLQSYVDAVSSKEVHAVVNYVAHATDVSFQVYEFGAKDPTEQERKIVTNPWNIESSPFGWMSKDKGRLAGNNVNVIVNGQELEGLGRSGKFVYEYSAQDQDLSQYSAASATQLFYTCNVYHDILYKLGFNEKAGNFQLTSNKGHIHEGDYIVANAQDHSGTNNANFATPVKGQTPRMNMYPWKDSNNGGGFTRDGGGVARDVGGVTRDGAFDAAIVIHEFTHGLSNRLTGGPSRADCLQDGESAGMGEGWSDFMALAALLKPTDKRSTDIPFSTWAVGNERGIRQYPYSTKTSVNPLSFESLQQIKEPHEVGTVWCTMLYEVLVNLMEKHGYTPNIIPEYGGEHAQAPKGGRHLAMKLVMTGMKFQPCHPDFVSARTAILDADKELTKGSNRCAILEGFAKRGLGLGARSGAYQNNYEVGKGCKPPDRTEQGGGEQGGEEQGGEEQGEGGWNSGGGGSGGGRPSGGSSGGGRPGGWSSGGGGSGGWGLRGRRVGHVSRRGSRSDE
ncbi:hypothetical protein QQS21_000634 [Conoideocrella luteorostrata]|uniref:Extracellular metalloproteinase n=1 Tax=Conoideocrella luteorostrata TaxID=1105319 RepID=A0AAJ0CYG3_9HYPO|nr:hypothetical protein QQS21_000634 [Conoideocrella luteorostrata]